MYVCVCVCVGPAAVYLVYGVCLAVLVSCVLLSLVILYRKRNADTQTDGKILTHKHSTAESQTHKHSGLKLMLHIQVA